MSTEKTESGSGGAAGSAATKQRRKTIVGKVRSDRMRKTRVVEVERLERHPKYGKFRRRRTAFYVHDEGEVSRVGDTVLIEETRPVSRTKRWRLLRVVSKAQGKVLAQLEGDIGAADALKELPGGPAREGGAPT